MGIFDNKYPYSDFHELNLDWILETVSNLEKRVDSLKNEFLEQANKYTDEKFAEFKKAETVKNHSEDEKSVKSEKKVDFAQIEKALKDVKKIGSDDEEKNALDIDDIRTLLEDDNSALFAAITASETILKEQNSNDFSDLTQISQEIFDLESFVENVCMMNCKVRIFASQEGPDYEILN